ncbi:MAG: putative ATP-grasp domain fused to redox center [Candidatus Methanohalarchaeum thermophilum]|uniref:ATP-grasp domain fused to redox center n=1 Tax=Methanohalarchaeum thermophilum TaxID=1903181 RepID=A0A1Q6DY05_METT1|nr:MAG: putative ATP-grasp domain fused to redox center [Candidatus Methanohalarchaeum thermophilum]
MLNRAEYESDLSGKGKEKRFAAVSRALDVIRSRFDSNAPLHEISTEMHRTVYDTLGVDDPYKGKKQLANEIAMDLIDEVEDFLTEDNEKNFRKVLLASIVSNSLDFGVMGHELDNRDLGEHFKKEFKEGELAIDDVDKIKEEAKNAEKITYILDNCGEVVFDSLVLDQIKEITDAEIDLLVRGAPIFNDVTLEEALELNLDKKVDNLIELGDRAVGVHFNYTSKKAEESLEDSDLILSKGMANYESLSEYDDEYNIAYTLRTKCKPVADSIGVEVNSNIAKLKKTQ